MKDNEIRKVIYLRNGMSVTDGMTELSEWAKENNVKIINLEYDRAMALYKTEIGFISMICEVQTVADALNETFKDYKE
ncbi:MAG: hypothetical protein V3R32_01335 [Nitrosomonadaceae bacterium]